MPKSMKSVESQSDVSNITKSKEKINKTADASG